MEHVWRGVGEGASDALYQARNNMRKRKRWKTRKKRKTKKKEKTEKIIRFCWIYFVGRNKWGRKELSYLLCK